MAGPKNALAAWGVSALHAVELPSGMKALVKLPSVAALMERESFPAELRETALAYVSGQMPVATREDLAKAARFTYEMVAEMIRYLASPGSEAWENFKEHGGTPSDEGWEPVTISGPELREMEIDEADLTALSRIASRETTPNTVTVASRLDRGMAEKAAEALAAGERANVQSTATFPGAGREPGRAPDRADGEDVGAEPERLPRSRRPGAALRRR